MTIQTLRSFLLWCSIIDYAILIAWAVLLISRWGWFYRLCERCYGISRQQFDVVNFAGLALFKAGILLFNLVPCVVLYLTG